MKVTVFGDIHYGNKGNSNIFNDDCDEYLNFLIDESKKQDIDTCIFLGDWFHSRNSVNIGTLKAGINGIRKLSQAFKKVVLILGNHDLYYRDSLKTHSLEWVKEFPNVQLIDTITTDGDFTYVPWIVGDMKKDVAKINTPFVFGHFELPGFLLNSMVKMPDIGQVSGETFNKNIQYVFSGHFHKRQQQITKSGTEIHYVGNAFPHNYSDANDLSRGFCILDTSGEVEYINWQDCPRYITISLSELLNDPFNTLTDKTYCKAKLDLNLEVEDVLFIREMMIETFNCREFAFVHEKKNHDFYEELGEMEFETVDQIVMKSLENIESKSFDKRKLMEIYVSL